MIQICHVTSRQRSVESVVEIHPEPGVNSEMKLFNLEWLKTLRDDFKQVADAGCGNGTQR
jgi:hypothetical protein